MTGNYLRLTGIVLLSNLESCIRPRFRNMKDYMDKQMVK